MLSISVLLRSRLVSSIAAIVGLLLVYVITRDLETVAKLLAASIFPVACIWYADELGTLTGISTGLLKPRISEPTPGIAVAIGGWALLLCIIITATVINL